MRFLFRCDASPNIGKGHLYRCKALAQELKKQGATTFFICRTPNLDIKQELGNSADVVVILHPGTTLEQDITITSSFYHQEQIDLAIIDHYNIDTRYQQQLYDSGVHWLQFDSFTNQTFLADWILNTSPSAKEGDYQVPEGTCLLLGPQYALLRQEFREVKRIKFRTEVKKILLSFGGSNDRSATTFCLKALESLDKNIVVLTTNANSSLPEIVACLSKNPHIKVIVDSPNVALHMANADIALIAGGTTTFEVAGMGLPGFIIPLVKHQVAHAEAWHNTGSLINIGKLKNLSIGDVRQYVTDLIDNPAQREAMAKAGMALVDCYGAERVAKLLLKEINV